MLAYHNTRAPAKVQTQNIPLSYRPLHLDIISNNCQYPAEREKLDNVYEKMFLQFQLKSNEYCTKRTDEPRLEMIVGYWILENTTVALP